MQQDKKGKPQTIRLVVKNFGMKRKMLPKNTHIDGHTDTETHRLNLILSPYRI